MTTRDAQAPPSTSKVSRAGGDDAADDGHVARPDGSAAGVPSLQSRLHNHCFVCGQAHEDGLKLVFRPDPEGGGVRAEFKCDPRFQGYAGLLHGGVACALLDGAMANALFTAGLVGHTARLAVRFRRPVLTNRPAGVTAAVRRSKGRLVTLDASISQDGHVAVTGTASFLLAPEGRDGVSHLPPRARPG